MKSKWMVPVKESFLSHQDALFPLCFVFSSLLNMVFFYLGLAYEENPLREYGFIAGCLLFAVLCGLSFLRALRKEWLPLHRLVEKSFPSNVLMEQCVRKSLSRMKPNLFLIKSMPTRQFVHGFR